MSEPMQMHDWGAKPTLTTIGVWVGGGLLTLAGLLRLIVKVRYRNGDFFQVLLGSLGPSFVSVVLTLLAWESILGILILGIVVLVAGRRHFFAVAMVSLVVVVIETGVTIMEFPFLGYPPGKSLQLIWGPSVLLLFGCLFLALALSTRTTRVLQIIVLALLVVLVADCVQPMAAAIIGYAPMVTQMWALDVSTLLAVAGWLVLVASVRTPGTRVDFPSD